MSLRAHVHGSSGLRVRCLRKAPQLNYIHEVCAGVSAAEESELSQGHRDRSCAALPSSVEKNRMSSFVT
jgi:hypothetical protein